MKKEITEREITTIKIKTLISEANTMGCREGAKGEAEPVKKEIRYTNSLAKLHGLRSDNMCFGGVAEIKFGLYY